MTWRPQGRKAQHLTLVSPHSQLFPIPTSVGLGTGFGSRPRGRIERELTDDADPVRHSGRHVVSPAEARLAVANALTPPGPGSDGAEKAGPNQGGEGGQQSRMDLSVVRPEKIIKENRWV